MIYSTFISANELATQINNPNWVIVDCRFDLANPSWGEQEYKQAHIPGAIYAHLDRDLSSKVIKGCTGRHPLPQIDDLVKRIRNWGIDENTQVVAYDSWPEKGLQVAARFWWLLQWLGHDSVAILDGGWKAYRELNDDHVVSKSLRSVGNFSPKPRSEWVFSSDHIEDIRLNQNYRLIDSRSADRYRGENETIDPVAGHIPGAFSSPYDLNFDQAGKLLPVKEIKERFIKIINHIPAKNVAFYCGSGVTAAVNLLAFKYAGLGNARLYAGSWSEWITKPNRPIALGDK